MKPRILLSFLTLAVLVCGAVWIRAHAAPWHPTSPDTFTYLRYSEVLSQGDRAIEQWGRGPFSYKPLYSWLISGLSGLSMDRETAGTLISVLSGGLLILPVFFLSGILSGPVIRWGVVLLIAAVPILVQYSGFILTESLFTFLFISSLAVTWWLLDRPFPKAVWIVPGILFALCALTRDVGLVLIPVAIFWIVGYKGWIRRERTREIGFCGLFFVLGLVLILSVPAISLNDKSLDDPSSRSDASYRFRSLSFLLVPDLKDPVSYERYWSALTPDGGDYYAEDRVRAFSDQSLVSILWKNKGQIAKTCYSGIIRYAQVLWYATPALFLLFLTIGLMIPFFSSAGGSFHLFLTSWALIYLLFYIISGSGSFAAGESELQRYLVPLFPLFFVWIGHGIWLMVSYAGNLIREKWGRMDTGHQAVLWGGCAVLTLLLLGSFSQPWMEWLTGSPQSRMSLEEAVGRKLAVLPNGRPFRIMARRPIVPYYAGADFVLTPFDSLDRVIRFAKSRGVTYIVFTSFDRRPFLKDVLRVSGVSNPGIRLELGVRDGARPGYLKFALYRVLPLGGG